jgi:hypothetical protein
MSSEQELQRGPEPARLADMHADRALIRSTRLAQRRRQNVGRHLPLAGMRTCRLVCKRWAAVIGESVTALGVSADLFRETVLADPEDATDGRGGGGSAHHSLDSDSSSDDEEDVGSDGDNPAAARFPASGTLPAQPRRAATVRAMRRLRRLSRQLARAFPRAHTVVIHIDIGSAMAGAGQGPAGAQLIGAIPRVAPLTSVVCTSCCSVAGPLHSESVLLNRQPGLTARRSAAWLAGMGTMRRQSRTRALRGWSRSLGACPTWRASGGLMGCLQRGRMKSSETQRPLTAVQSMQAAAAAAAAGVWV